jgi:hypothetical protein
MCVNWRPAYAASCEWQLAYSLQVVVLFGQYTTLASASTASPAASPARNTNMQWNNNVQKRLEVVLCGQL